MHMHEMRAFFDNSKINRTTENQTSDVTKFLSCYGIIAHTSLAQQTPALWLSTTAQMLTNSDN